MGPTMLLRVIVFALLILPVPTGMILSGKKVRIGVFVAAENQVSIDAISHDKWDQLLKDFVDDKGEVHYKDWSTSEAGVAMLDQYIDELSSASLTKYASKEGQLAFWINAYNAVTIKGILREYPTTSIRNHTAKFGGYNIWKDLMLRVGGGEYSLDDIEHQLLRPMGEPRIHFAIVCASVSFPKLLNEAFDKEKLDSQLSKNATDFFAEAKNFSYDAKRQEFVMSSILSWFGKDFGRNQEEVLRAISPYLPESARAIANQNSVSVSYLQYNWNLNGH